MAGWLSTSHETFWTNVRARPRGARAREEGVDVRCIECRPALVDQLVLAPVMDGAQHRAVAKVAPQLGDVGVEVVLVNLAEALPLSKHGGNCLHLLGHGGVRVGEVCAARANVPTRQSA